MTWGTIQYCILITVHDGSEAIYNTSAVPCGTINYTIYRRFRHRLQTSVNAEHLFSCNHWLTIRGAFVSGSSWHLLLMVHLRSNGALGKREPLVCIARACCRCTASTRNALRTRFQRILTSARTYDQAQACDNVR